MCMITYVPGSIPLPEDGIRNGSFINNDGHGWAIASNDGIQIGKSMDFDTAFDELREARKDHGERSLVMFHSRFATHGTVDEFNVHPFWADDYTAVAHNGILPMAWHPTKKDKRSDTRILVDRTIPHYLGPNGVPSRKAGKTLGKVIGSGNKLTILSVASGVPKVRIINAHLGDHHEGVWYSNSGYLPPYNGWRSRYAPYTGTTIGGRWDDEPSTVGKEYEDRKCDVCNVDGFVLLETGVCEICHVCTSCYYDERWCTCPWNQRKELTTLEDVVEESLNPQFSLGSNGWAD